MELVEGEDLSQRIAAAGGEQAPGIVVVLTWLEELKAKLPAKRREFS